MADTVLNYQDELISALSPSVIKRRVQDYASRSAKRGLWLAAGCVAFGLLLVSIVVVAVVVYTALYYALVPLVHLQKPVYFNYDPVDASTGADNLRPRASTNLVNHQWDTDATSGLYTPSSTPLSRGVNYDISLTLRIPDSPRNRNVGVVMAKIEVEDCAGTLLARSIRPILPRYRGMIARAFYQLAYIIPLSVGTMREESTFTVPLIDGFKEHSSLAACAAKVELSKSDFEIYEASMQFSAQPTLTRWYLYNLMVVSAPATILFIVVCELVLIALGVVFAGYQFYQKRGNKTGETPKGPGAGEGPTLPGSPTQSDRGEGELRGDTLETDDSPAVISEIDESPAVVSESEDPESDEKHDAPQPSAPAAASGDEESAPPTAPRLIVSDPSQPAVRGSNAPSDTGAELRRRAVGSGLEEDNNENVGDSDVDNGDDNENVDDDDVGNDDDGVDNDDELLTIANDDDDEEDLSSASSSGSD